MPDSSQTVHDPWAEILRIPVLSLQGPRSDLLRRLLIGDPAAVRLVAARARKTVPPDSRLEAMMRATLPAPAAVMFVEEPPEAPVDDGLAPDTGEFGKQVTRAASEGELEPEIEKSRRSPPPPPLPARPTPEQSASWLEDWKRRTEGMPPPGGKRKSTGNADRHLFPGESTRVEPDDVRPRKAKDAPGSFSGETTRPVDPENLKRVVESSRSPESFPSEPTRPGNGDQMARLAREEVTEEQPARKRRKSLFDVFKKS